MGEDKKNNKCQCQKSDGTNYICGTNCVNKTNDKYYSKYLRYKMKYLRLKSKISSFVNEESEQDSFRNKIKYLNLKNSNLDFAAKKTYYNKMKYLNLKNFVSQKLQEGGNGIYDRLIELSGKTQEQKTLINSSEFDVNQLLTELQDTEDDENLLNTVKLVISKGFDTGTIQNIRISEMLRFMNPSLNKLLSSFNSNLRLINSQIEINQKNILFIKEIIKKSSFIQETYPEVKTFTYQPTNYINIINFLTKRIITYIRANCKGQPEGKNQFSILKSTLDHPSLKRFIRERLLNLLNIFSVGNLRKLNVNIITVSDLESMDKMKAIEYLEDVCEKVIIKIEEIIDGLVYYQIMEEILKLS